MVMALPRQLTMDSIHRGFRTILEDTNRLQPGAMVASFVQEVRLGTHQNRVLRHILHITGRSRPAFYIRRRILG